MFYRMTRLHWEESRRGDVAASAESLREKMESIAGLQFAELAETGPGEGMIIAAYDDGSDHKASAEVTLIEESLFHLLTAKPHGHEGTVVVAYGDAPSSR